MKLNQYEEEIALTILGIGGVIALLFGQKEIATACFGFVGGYLIKGLRK